MERILRLEDIRNCSSSPIHCVAQTGKLYNCKRISLRSGMKKWSGSSWEWPSALQDSRLRGLMRTFIAKKFLSFIFFFFFFFFLHLWFLSFKVNDLSTTITTTKKPWFSCVFPGEWKQTQGGGGGREERSDLFFWTSLFALLSLRASASRFLPLAWKNATSTLVLQSTSSFVKGIHGYCSFTLAMSRYPTNHAI